MAVQVRVYTAAQADTLLAAQVAALAPAYSSSSAYAVGDFCSKDGSYYQCVTAIESGGEEWTAAHWSQRNLSSLFSSENTSLVAAVNATIASRCASLDPATSSIADIINALKGN